MAFEIIVGGKGSSRAAEAAILQVTVFAAGVLQPKASSIGAREIVYVLYPSS